MSSFVLLSGVELMKNGTFCSKFVISIFTRFPLEDTLKGSIAFMHLSISSPREGWGGGSGNLRDFDRDAYPQGGDFHLTSCI